MNKSDLPINFYMLGDIYNFLLEKDEKELSNLLDDKGLDVALLIATFFSEDTAENRTKLTPAVGLTLEDFINKYKITDETKKTTSDKVIQKAKDLYEKLHPKRVVLMELPIEIRQHEILPKLRATDLAKYSMASGSSLLDISQELSLSKKQDVQTKVIKELRTLIQPPFKSYLGSLEIQVILRIANLEILEGNLKRAEELLINIPQNYLSEARILISKLVEAKLNKYGLEAAKQTIENFKKNEKLNPGHITRIVYCEIGRQLAKQGKIKEAREAIDQALQPYQNPPKSWIAVTLAEAGFQEEAEKIIMNDDEINYLKKAHLLTRINLGEKGKQLIRKNVEASDLINRLFELAHRQYSYEGTNSGSLKTIHEIIDILKQNHSISKENFRRVINNLCEYGKIDEALEIMKFFSIDENEKEIAYKFIILALSKTDPAEAVKYLEFISDEKDYFKVSIIPSLIRSKHLSLAEKVTETITYPGYRYSANLQILHEKEALKGNFEKILGLIKEDQANAKETTKRTISFLAKHQKYSELVNFLTLLKDLPFYKDINLDFNKEEDALSDKNIFIIEILLDYGDFPEYERKYDVDDLTFY